jgi:phosphopantothenoylcysteine decarboxylase/phosphopantothenate--cysteine ligase
VLKGKKILIGITGSIAAYKIPFLIRLLKKEGAEVQVVMTPAARDFVTPLTLSTLSGNPAYSYPFDQKDGTWTSHVEMGRWADVMLLAPVTAATLGKMAHGIADNLLVTTYLSAKCPVFFAPAMDLDMYRHPATGENIQKLIGFGHTLIEPQVGELASGLTGAGRMEEPENIVQVLKNHFSEKKVFSGKKFLVTAGPTYEAIDPVRFIGNHSSGKMGFALAQAAAEKGADVTLIAGPVDLETLHPAIHRVDVISANEMYKACKKYFPDADVTVMAAAVADFTPENVASQKIKKGAQTPTIKLKPTRDILQQLGKEKKPGTILAGFALETDNELENARTKLKNKNLDLIVLNSLKDEGAGFGVSTNRITILDKNGKQYDYPLKSKKEVAGDILDRIAELIR